MKTIKQNKVLAAAIFIFLIGATIFFLRSNRQAAGENLLPVELRSIRFSDGWGYEVLVDRKVYIHQDYIPAIQSYKRFATEADALLIGKEVVEKIKQGKKPSVSVQDIVACGIRY